MKPARTPRPGSGGMVKALAELKAACDALPPLALQPVACPIFGNAPPPPAPPTAGVPPVLAAASAELAAALAGAPSLGSTWPFANPPAVQAQIDGQAPAGRGRDH